MNTGVDAVRLCSSIYGPAKWDHYWDGSDPDGICAGFSGNFLVFRGSLTKEDWYRDLLALAVPTKDHPQLGLVHEGFDDGMEEFFAKTVQFLPEHLIVTGHSLGAARAWLYAGRLVASGRIPYGIFAFGSPRPGCQQLKDLLKNVPKTSYKNRSDHVTDVPFWLPDFPYLQMQDFTVLNEAPTDSGLLCEHHIQLYVDGVSKATN